MKAINLSILFLVLLNSIEAKNRLIEADTIQLCYQRRFDVAVGGYDHCVYVYRKDSLFYYDRKCFGKYTLRHPQKEFLFSEYLENPYTFGSYKSKEEREEVDRENLRLHYELDTNFILLDLEKRIEDSSLSDFFQVLDRLKKYGERIDADTSLWTCYSTGSEMYMIKKGKEIKHINAACFTEKYSWEKEIEGVLGIHSSEISPCRDKEKEEHRLWKEKQTSFHLMKITSPNLLTQVYRMQQSNFNTISPEILDSIEKMGRDSSLFLTELEGEYLHRLYNILEKQKYSLCGKKLAFLSGKHGKIQRDKSLFFINERSSIMSNNSPNYSTLYIFHAEQKKASGGYDAAIVYGNKRLIPIEEVVRNLKNKL